MEPQLSNFLLSFLLLLLLSSAFSTATAFPTTAPAAAPTATNPLAFIRSCCNATLYPDVCYASLSRYADAVQRDPACLARVAIGVSLVRAHQARARFVNMTGRADYGPNPRAAAALRDCRSTFSDAVGQMRDSLRQMRQLELGPAGSGSGEEEEEIRFQLSNVQTWMSAALTNEDTCSDGFEDVEDGPLKEEVCEMVAVARELTSNALALVNSYAAAVTS